MNWIDVLEWAEQSGAHLITFYAVAFGFVLLCMYAAAALLERWWQR